MIRESKGYLYFILFMIGTLKTEYIAVNFQKCWLWMAFVAYRRWIFHHFLSSCHFLGDLSWPCIYLQNFLIFNAPILHPKKKRLRISPRTGILSIPYFRRRMDGIVSTPFRNRLCFLKSSVLRSLCCFALWFDFDDTVFLLTRLNILGWHFSLCGQSWHWLFWKEMVHWPVPWL